VAAAILTAEGKEINMAIAIGMSACILTGALLFAITLAIGDAFR